MKMQDDQINIYLLINNVWGVRYLYEIMKQFVLILTGKFNHYMKKSSFSPVSITRTLSDTSAHSVKKVSSRSSWNKSLEVGVPLH